MSSQSNNQNPGVQNSGFYQILLKSIISMVLFTSASSCTTTANTNQETEYFSPLRPSYSQG
jgi:hypothetical protein